MISLTKLLSPQSSIPVTRCMSLDWRSMDQSLPFVISYTFGTLIKFRINQLG